MAAPLLSDLLYSVISTDQIRVLRVLPEDGNDIQCTLTVVEHNAELAYNALSYTWGDPLPQDVEHLRQPREPTRIMVNGIIKDVTPNLHDALLQLRSRSLTVEVPIWIDAVCINQTDFQEKALQVAKMDEIYTGAQHVYAWLGPEDEYTEAAFRVLERIAQIPEDEYALHRTMDVQHLGIAEGSWAALIVFFHRNYFTRAWIIQEVILAGSMVILCGDHIISERIMRPAASYLVRSMLWLKLVRYTPAFLRHGKAASAIGSIITALGNPSSGAQRALSQLSGLGVKKASMSGRGSNAGDLRDLVYATYGLVKRAMEDSDSCMRHFPVIDYSENVKVADVFVRWAHFMLSKRPDEKEDYWLFTLVEDRSVRRVKELPSWVPDQSVGLLPATFGSVLSGGEPLWYPSGIKWDGKTGGTITFTDDPTKIGTTAAYFDTIRSAGVPWSVLDQAQDFSPILDLVTEIEWPYSDPLDALARCLSTDSREQQGPSPGLVFTQWIMQLCRQYQNETAVSTLHERLVQLTRGTDAQIWTSIVGFLAPPMESWVGQPNMYTQMMAMKCREFGERAPVVGSGRGVFLTGKNYLGIAAESVEEGDEVWIMPSSPVLFVLREVEEGAYELMGSGYVQGIMMGEFAKKSEGGLKWTEIELV